MILITGASKGIGEYLLYKYLSSINNDIILGTYWKSSIKQEQREHLTQVDITCPIRVKAWLNSIDPSGITLINCAGINYNSFAHKADIYEWQKVIDVNLIGTFNVINCVLPIMREQGYGRIINLSSVVSKMAVPATSAYAASKAGLTGMIKSIAVENISKGITINNINLGYHEIGMIEQVPEDYQKILKEKIPAGKFGDPEQIYNTINYIIENDYLTGTDININGGLY